MGYNLHSMVRVELCIYICDLCWYYRYLLIIYNVKCSKYVGIDQSTSCTQIQNGCLGLFRLGFPCGTYKGSLNIQIYYKITGLQFIYTKGVMKDITNDK